MNRKILCMVLCLIMSIGMLSGCGSEDNEESVKVTAKLEKEYIERMEAYQEYFSQVRNDYSDYNVYMTITLDEEHLPLMWLCFESVASEDNYRTQLICADNGKVEILAEETEYLIPFRGSGKILCTADDNQLAYLYDEKEKGFHCINNELEDLAESDTVYTEDELEEKMEYLLDLAESSYALNNTQIAVNSSSKEVVYLGKIEPDKYYSSLRTLGVILGVILDPNDEENYLVVINPDYLNNKTALKYLENYSDVELDEEELENVCSRYGDDITNDCIKLCPEDTLVAPDGRICTSEEKERYNKCLNILRENGWIESWGRAWKKYFNDLDAEQILRELKNNPTYTQEELLLYLTSIAYKCNITEIDLEEYNLSKVSDNYIANLVNHYIIGFSNVNIIGNVEKDFFSEELIEGRSTLLETEPYQTIREGNVLETVYSENIVTICCDTGKIYEFQIEFNDAFDEITGITYVDPYASLPE